MLKYFKSLTKSDVISLVMSCSWIALLIPSIANLLTSDLETYQRVLGMIGALSFIAIYVYSLAKAMTFGGDINPHKGVAVGVVLMLISVSLYPIIGWQSFLYLNFVLPVWNFLTPVRLAMLLGSALISAATAFIVWSGETPWEYIFNAIGVFIVTAGSRFFIDTAKKQIRLQARLAVLEERDRVARDIHDVLGHSLTVITLKSQVASKLVEKNPTAARAELAQISALSREAISEVRATVSGLRERHLDQELDDAQAALEQARITVHIVNQGVSVRFDQLFAWIVRECVTNIIRHSEASKVTINVSECALQVSDNGQGFPNFCDNTWPDIAPPHAEDGTLVSAGDADTSGAASGNGLRGILERVTLAGGHVLFHNDPGATVTVEMLAHISPNHDLT
ncbi:histidine kinase [Arcanobacterium canis]